MSDYPIKSPRKLIEVALPLEVINVSGRFGVRCFIVTFLPVPPYARIYPLYPILIRSIAAFTSATRNRTAMPILK